MVSIYLFIALYQSKRVPLNGVEKTTFHTKNDLVHFYYVLYEGCVSHFALLFVKIFSQLDLVLYAVNLTLFEVSSKNKRSELISRFYRRRKTLTLRTRIKRSHSVLRQDYTRDSPESSH